MRHTHIQFKREAEQSILTMNKKQVFIERIKLINSGHLADNSYALDILIGKLTPIKPIKVYNNLYEIGV